MASFLAKRGYHSKKIISHLYITKDLTKDPNPEPLHLRRARIKRKISQKKKKPVQPKKKPITPRK